MYFFKRARGVVARGGAQGLPRVTRTRRKSAVSITLTKRPGFVD